MATMGALLGGVIPFHRDMPGGFVPVVFSGEETVNGKDGLTLLNDRPINAETPPHLLDDTITPTSRYFAPGKVLVPTYM